MIDYISQVINRILLSSGDVAVHIDIGDLLEETRDILPMSGKV